MKDKERVNYLRVLDRLAKEKSRATFNHEGADESALVMATIFKRAKEVVKIFAKDLNGDISSQEEYLNELRGFIDRGGEVKVLLQENANLLHSKALEMLKSYMTFNKQVTVFDTSESVVSETGEEIHFLVADKNMLRIESDIENYSGFATFNDPEIASKLDELFEKMYSKVSDKEPN